MTNTSPAKPTSAELRAVQKDSCPACGAQATWHPGKQKLLCSYCGTEAPGELDRDSGKIVEIDLVTALRDLPEKFRGWKAPKRSVRCRHCHAVSVFDPERVGQNCDFCGSPELLDYDEIKSPIRPQSILPFKIDEPRMRDAVKKWYGSKWLAPNKFKSRALLDTAKGMYIPYWTFDANVKAEWSADSGTYYYETRRSRGSDGKMRSQRVQRVRWRPASGRLEHFFDDEPVPGTQGLHAKLLRAIEPFPTTTDLVPYDTAYLSGFVVEHYQVVLFDAAKGAREQMDDKLRGICGAQVPGDTYRNLRVRADYGDETFKHVLVPIWILAYQYGPKTYQLLMNGYTGRLEGEYPKSPWKIAFLVLGAILVVLLVAGFAA